jgi:protein involved in polysaccharide export with SLBB domain
MDGSVVGTDKRIHVMSVGGKAFGITVALLALAMAGAGCSNVARQAIPASCVQPNALDRPRGDKRPIDFSILRQDPPPVYLLGARDVLGIYVEGVLGKIDEAPPVYFPQRWQQREEPPAVGYPIPVREDGTISLPLAPPIEVAGLTVAQAEDEIRKAFTVRQKILQPGRDRIIVTLMKKRNFNILVVREDTASQGSFYQQQQQRQSGGFFEAQKLGVTKSIDLPAYENDVLHALAESGGLPGVDTKNEIKIMRGAFKSAAERDEYLRTLADPLTRAEVMTTGRKIHRIPLRIGPADPPLELTQEDIILTIGDVVFVESRDEEVFYTGGLLQGGQYPIPRDHDLDVLGAIAMSGGSIAAAAGGTGNRNGGGVGTIFPPTRVIVLREVNGQQVAIKLSTKTAMLNPQERILVQPNDFVILEYTGFEAFANVMVSTFTFSVSVNDLFN